VAIGTVGVTAGIGIATAVAGTDEDEIAIVAVNASAVPVARIAAQALNVALTAMRIAMLNADRIAVASVRHAPIAANATATTRAIAKEDATAGATRVRAIKVPREPGNRDQGRDRPRERDAEREPANAPQAADQGAAGGNAASTAAPGEEARNGERSRPGSPWPASRSSWWWRFT